MTAEFIALAQADAMESLVLITDGPPRSTPAECHSFVGMAIGKQLPRPAILHQKVTRFQGVHTHTYIYILLVKNARIKSRVAQLGKAKSAAEVMRLKC